MSKPKLFYVLFMGVVFGVIFLVNSITVFAEVSTQCYWGGNVTDYDIWGQPICTENYYTCSCADDTDLPICTSQQLNPGADGECGYGWAGCDCVPRCPVGVTLDCGVGSSCEGTQQCDPTTAEWYCDYSSTQGSACSDGDTCTIGDVCSSGVCDSGINIPVNGTWSGCGSTATCEGESCGGTCVGSAPACTCSSNSDCSDGDSCTTDVCNNPGTVSSYCTNTNNPVNGSWACVSGSAECQGDSCGGTCVGSAPICGTCDDGDSCTTDSGTYPNCTNTNNPVNGTWSCDGTTPVCSATCGGVCLGSEPNCSESEPEVSASVSIWANPTTIASGASSMLNWSYDSASYCTITPPASISSYPNGSGSISTGNLTASRTYSISCDPGGAYSTASVIVQVASSFSLSVIKSGQGTVTSTSVPTQANQINCGNECASQSVSFASNANVNLAATPGLGRVFTGWSGACTGKGSCSVPMNSGKTVYANFAADPYYSEF